MKKINSKSLMVLTILVASTLAMPAMVSSYETNDTIGLNQFDGSPTDLVNGFRSGFSSMFGGMGYAGEVLGLVLQMLLLDVAFDNITHKQMLPGVYVYNAFHEKTQNFTNVNISNTERYYLPYNYSKILEFYNVEGIAYCDVTRNGMVDIEVTTGAGVTFIIWDHDNTFINALTRILNFFKKVINTMGNSPTEEEMRSLLKEGISVLSWFLIHLNDIFTGDELFVLNPITYQNIVITPSGENITVQKQLRVTGDDYEIGGPVPDEPLNETVTNKIYNQADNQNDDFVKWLATEYSEISAPLTYSHFTFDLFQLWMKNFNINIDLGELSFDGSTNFASMFKGMDVEFYLFTHHLVGNFLYNDTNDDDVLSVKYRAFKDPNTNETITDSEGNDVEVPSENELTHRLYMESVEDFNYIEPYVNDSNTISWGLNMTGVDMQLIPLGVDLESYQNETSPENLENIYLGLSFSPDLSTVIADEDGKRYTVASAPVKLDQHFGEWNDGDGPNNDIDGLDLSVIYVSTVLHFHLTAKLEEMEYKEYIGANNESYHKDKKVSVGNYLTQDIASKLEFVDIASENYTLGSNEFEATSTIIPLGLWQMEEERHNTFEVQEGEDVTAFAGDLRITANFSVMAYAVCYPDFNGSGEKLVHDPTFNVFMVFEPTAFWALILLVGGVSILGVATVLIKRKKDGKTPF